MNYRIKIKGFFGEVEIYQEWDRDWNADYTAKIKENATNDAIKAYQAMNKEQEK